MSGHSKWHTIKNQKAATDAKRGQMFTKLTAKLSLLPAKAAAALKAITLYGWPCSVLKTPACPGQYQPCHYQSQRRR